MAREMSSRGSFRYAPPVWLAMFTGYVVLPEGPPRNVKSQRHCRQSEVSLNCTLGHLQQRPASRCVAFPQYSGSLTITQLTINIISSLQYTESYIDDLVNGAWKWRDDHLLKYSLDYWDWAFFFILLALFAISFEDRSIVIKVSAICIIIIIIVFSSFLAFFAFLFPAGSNW